MTGQTPVKSTSPIRPVSVIFVTCNFRRLNTWRALITMLPNCLQNYFQSPVAETFYYIIQALDTLFTLKFVQLCTFQGPDLGYLDMSKDKFPACIKAFGTDLNKTFSAIPISLLCKKKCTFRSLITINYYCQTFEKNINIAQ